MSLKPYDVTVYGYSTTLLLSDEDAKREGLFVDPATVDSEPAPEPEPVAVAAPDPTPEPEPVVAEVAEKQAPAPRNKARNNLFNKGRG